MMDAVLKLRNRGLSIFPVSTETKKPIVKWDRLQDELPTYEEVTEWFNAPNRAVGVATGPVSNLFLLDFDLAKHPEAKEFYDARTFPRTWKEKTKSGGLHLYFKWSSALDAKQTNTTSKLWTGVDTKGYGGYSKISPSEGYEWIVAPHHIPLASVPQWLLDALPNRDNGRVIEGTQKPVDWMVAELEAVQPGSGIDGRTPTFVRAIGRLKAKGLSEIEVKSLLAPWAVKYEYPKLDSLVIDQFNRYPPRSEQAAVRVDGQGESVETFLADHQSVKWICEPFIAEEAIGFIAGLPESRKSWILIDLGIECARGGGLWMNKFPVMGKKVLLIDQERSKSEVQRRIQAVIAGKGLHASDIRSTLFVRSGTSTRIDLQNSYDSLRKELADIRPDLILIDSFATFHTKNESNRAEIQQVMERIKEMRNEFKCAIIIIHHETKQAYQNKKDGQESSYLDMAGNIAIPAAAEFCMNVVKHDDESSFCHHTKSTQGPKEAPFLVKVRDLNSDRSQIAVEAY